MPNRLQTCLRRQMLGIATLLCLSPALVTAQPETLYFAPLPMEEPEEVVKQFKPMLNFLEKRLGVRIEIRYSTSYKEILERFRTGQIDLAYLGPLPYISLRDSYSQAEPLVHFLEKDGQATYSCALFGTEQKLPKPLRNNTFALTQPLSTCGYLAVDALLRQGGETLALQRYRYLDKHDEAVLAVARGDYDFGGAKTSIARKYTHLGIVIIGETPPLPSFALVANSRRLSAARMTQLRRILAELDPKARDRTLMSEWGGQLRNGAINAADSDYEVLRRWRRQTSIPEKGNF